MMTTAIASTDNQILQLAVAAATDVGRVRALNEDSVLAMVRPAGEGDAAAMLAVADGMGGHHGGDIASSLVIDTLKEGLAWLVEAPDDSADTAALAHMISPAFRDFQHAFSAQTKYTFLEQNLCMAIEQANQRIFTYARQRNCAQEDSPGTTLTCAFIIGRVAIIANVGDSRTYLVRNHVLHRLTEDHSFVATLIQLGHLTEDQIYGHPQRGLVMRSLGHESLSAIDIQAIELEPGDRLMLCSDGLWEQFPDQDQLRVLAETKNVDEAVAQLIAEANKRGGNDNVSVIVAAVESAS